MKTVAGLLCFKVQDGSAYLNRRARYAALKKKLAIFIAVFIVFVIIIGLCASEISIAHAADDSASEEEIRAQLAASVDEVINGLNTEDLQRFIDSLGTEQREALEIEDIKQALRALAAGNSKDFFGGMISVLSKSVGSYFAGFLSGFITIIIICLLKNMLSGMMSGLSGGSTAEVVHIVCYCAVIIVLMTGVGVVIGTVTKTINTLTKLSSVLFPIILTLLSMLGGSTTVAAYSPLMAVLSGGIMKIITSVIVPAFIATIVFSIVGNISKNIKLDKLTKVVKSASSWLVGIVFGLFATFLTVQGVTGGVVDKFSFNVAKFALSSYVPVLGGYLSDGFDLLSTSLVLVKNALGYSGALILISIVLFPLLKVVIFSLSLRLTAAIAEPVGDARISKLLSGVADNMTLLITALAGVAFLFYILILLLIGSCNMGL